MDNKTLSLTTDGVRIQGPHYTVSNGFISKADGTVNLRYSDMLSVEFVKRRSKKAMYTVLFLGCILIAVLSVIRANIDSNIRDLLRIESVQDAIDTAQSIYDTIEQGRDSEAYKKAKTVVTVVIVMTAVVSFTGVVYFFTGRRFLELTSMRGTYRVIAKRGDSDMKSMAAQIQERISRSMRN